MTPTKKLLLAQVVILFCGTIFAWTKLIPQFITFSPNPFLTPCVYGSIAFLVVLFWAVLLYQRPDGASERYLRNALLFCVAFAASVVLYEAAEYYHVFGFSTNVFICNPGVPPTETPCFTGMLFFIAAYGVALYTARVSRRSDRMPG